MRPSSCIWCHREVLDGREESGAEGPDWKTEDGDFGCDKSPESGPEGCGSHLPPEDPALRAYLLDVWGYARAVDVDPMTLDCIRENAEDGYLLDQAVMRLRKRSLDATL